ncbi:unnamed protein product [Adineta ricciae]|uniref:Uncharacterized protein n=1 Tax=Adineta ricciae TaxID=249248 RepID=A0A813PIM6_ADIRI|nr:unnamed protein product [Adineta ricciae]
MSKDGWLVEENDVITSQVDAKTNSYNSNKNQISQQAQHEDHFQLEQLNLIDEHKDLDSDSGISSVRRRRSKVATSLSGTHVTTDDELEDDDHLRKGSSRANTADLQHRASDASSITDFTIKTSSEFHLNTSKASSRASGLNLPPLTSPALAVTTTQMASASGIGPKLNDTKEKRGVRKFIRKIFKSSPSSSTLSNPPKSPINLRSDNFNPSKSPQLNIDLVHGTAYPPMSPLPVTQGPIRLLVLRHGERLDRYYSSQWLRQAFDKDGNFCRFSPILPETLPFRASIRDFDLDPPLTYKGLKDAFHTGTVLRDKAIHITYCYSSPALRCVQTASKILEGLQLQNKLKIRIEPGLFECTGWYTASETSNVLTMPRFMTKKELIENKYSIDKHYTEHMTIAEVSQFETELEFYQRSHAVTASLMKMHEAEYISQIQQGQLSPQYHLHILFIAHAPSLETCTRKLCGGKFRPDTLPHVIRNVDFLTMTVIEKTDNNADKWVFRRSSFYGDEF